VQIRIHRYRCNLCKSEYKTGYTYFDLVRNGNGNGNGGGNGNVNVNGNGKGKGKGNGNDKGKGKGTAFVGLQASLMRCVCLQLLDGTLACSCHAALNGAVQVIHQDIAMPSLNSFSMHVQ
jgi:hypothetical protein